MASRQGTRESLMATLVVLVALVAIAALAIVTLHQPKVERSSLVSRGGAPSW